MNRRSLIKAALTTAGLASAGGMTIWLNTGPGTDSLNWQSTLSLLNKLDTKKLISSGLWQPAQILSHLAQSVEYSMTGYPIHKSAVFKSIVGKSAFSAFSYKGVMTHSLIEPIPGAPELASTDSDHSLSRLIASLSNFDSFNGKLQPHFAYGKLTKEEYRLAHLMHIHNHLTEIIMQ